MQYRCHLATVTGAYLFLFVAASAQNVSSCAASPASVNFGNVVVTAASTQTVTITNNGIAPVSLLQATVSGAGFSINGLTTPLVLASGQSTSFSTTFAPPGAGSFNGSVSIRTTATNSPTDVPLSGAGITLLLSASPASSNFGNVVVGDSSTLPVSLTNTGTGAVTISQANVAGREFSINGLSLPLALAAGASTGFTVTFSPASSGNSSGTIAILSNATNSPTDEPLAGAGIHAVDLAWQASTSTVAGYNVYRGAASGGPYTRLNSSLVNGIAYTDTSVATGTTYYYVTTAVDPGNNESVFSNEAAAIVPST